MPWRTCACAPPTTPIGPCASPLPRAAAAAQHPVAAHSRDAHRRLAQGGDKEIQTDLAHRDQARVIPASLQFGIEQRQIVRRSTADIQGVDTQRITVAIGMRRTANRVEICDLHRRVDAMRNSATGRQRPHLRLIGVKLRRIDMAMGVDPVCHSG